MQIGLGNLPPNPPGDVTQRFGGRTIAGLILLVVAILLVGLTTTVSWWSLSSSRGMSSGWYLGNVCSSGSCQDYGGYPALHDTFGLTDALVLGAVVLGVVSLVLFVLSIFWPKVGVGVLVAGILGSLLVLAAPIYLFVALPGAYNATGTPAINSFFGSSTQPGFLFGSTTFTWGGGTGWYLAFVAFAVFLISTLVAFSASRRLAAYGNVRVSPQWIPAAGAGAPDTFCPVCGTHYPYGTQFCSKDASPLKPTQ